MLLLQVSLLLLIQETTSTASRWLAEAEVVDPPEAPSIMWALKMELRVDLKNVVATLFVKRVADGVIENALNIPLLPFSAVTQ